MKRLFSKITITSKATNEEIIIDFVNDISIKSTWKEFVDTCEIRFPKKITKDGNPIVVGLNSIFKRGDKIKVEFSGSKQLTSSVNQFNAYICSEVLATEITFVSACDTHETDVNEEAVYLNLKK